MVTVADLSGLTASITSQDDADCNGASTGEVTVEASGSTPAYTYALDGVTFLASGTFTGLAAGNYTVTAQDANGCLFPVSVTIAEPTPVVGSLDATTDADCNGSLTGEATLSASGGTPPYTFDIGAGPQAIGVFTNLTAGISFIDIEDANGCSYEIDINIGEPIEVLGAIDSQSGPDCFGASTGATTISGSGGTPPYTYDIGSGAQASGTFTGLAVGLYTIDILDVNDCPGSVSVILAEPTEVIGALDAQTDASCSGMPDATMTVSASGGTPPYTFDIGNGPQGTGFITGLTAGSYTVNIFDAVGCSGSIQVDLIEPVSLTAALVTSADVICNAGGDGSLEVSAQDGTLPYSFDIGNGAQVSGIFTDLAAGSYSVTAMDVNGCSVQVR